MRRRARAGRLGRRHGGVAAWRTPVPFTVSAALPALPPLPLPPPSPPTTPRRRLPNGCGGAQNAPCAPAGKGRASGRGWTGGAQAGAPAVPRAIASSPAGSAPIDPPHLGRMAGQNRRAPVMMRRLPSGPASCRPVPRAGGHGCGCHAVRMRGQAGPQSSAMAPRAARRDARHGPGGAHQYAPDKVLGRRIMAGGRRDPARACVRTQAAPQSHWLASCRDPFFFRCCRLRALRVERRTHSRIAACAPDRRYPAATGGRLGALGPSFALAKRAPALVMQPAMASMSRRARLAVRTASRGRRLQARRGRSCHAPISPARLYDSSCRNYRAILPRTCL